MIIVAVFYDGSFDCIGRNAIVEEPWNSGIAVRSKGQWIGVPMVVSAFNERRCDLFGLPSTGGNFMVTGLGFGQGGHHRKKSRWHQTPRSH